MSDPAIEAAQRLIDKYGDLADLPMDRDDLIAVAREALKPIREKHKPMVIQCVAPDCGAEICDHEDDCPVDYPVTVCATCWGIAEMANPYHGEDRIGDHLFWPCDTALLTYTTEELER